MSPKVQEEVDHLKDLKLGLEDIRAEFGNQFDIPARTSGIIYSHETGEY